MREQYERALKALADKMEQLSHSEDKTSQFANCTSMLNVAKAMEKIGRIIIALEYYERMDNEDKETADKLFGDFMSIRKVGQ